MTVLDLDYRCGSYPFRYIAEDFGLPYGVVLRTADQYERLEPMLPDDLEVVWNTLGNAPRVADFTCRVLQTLREVRP